MAYIYIYINLKRICETELLIFGVCTTPRFGLLDFVGWDIRVEVVCIGIQVMSVVVLFG